MRDTEINLDILFPLKYQATETFNMCYRKFFFAQNMARVNVHFQILILSFYNYYVTISFILNVWA